MSSKMVAVFVGVFLLLGLAITGIVYGVTFDQTINPQTGEAFQKVTCEGTVRFNGFSDAVSPLRFLDGSVNCAAAVDPVCERGSDAFALIGYSGDVFMVDSLGTIPGADAKDSLNYKAFKDIGFGDSPFQVIGCSSDDRVTLVIEDEDGIRTSIGVDIV